MAVRLSAVAGILISCYKSETQTETFSRSLDIWVYIEMWRDKCEMQAFESHPMNNRRFPVLKLLKWKPCQYLQRLIRTKYQNINLLQQLITVCYVLREARESWHDSTSIMSDVGHTSVHQLCRIHLSISMTFRHLRGTSVSASNQSNVNLWLSVLVVMFVQHIQLDMGLDRRPVYVISSGYKLKLQSSAR